MIYLSLGVVVTSFVLGLYLLVQSHKHERMARRLLESERRMTDDLAALDVLNQAKAASKLAHSYNYKVGVMIVLMWVGVAGIWLSNTA